MLLYMEAGVGRHCRVSYGLLSKDDNTHTHKRGEEAVTVVDR